MLGFYIKTSMSSPDSCLKTTKIVASTSSLNQNSEWSNHTQIIWLIMNEDIIYGRNRKIFNCPDEVLKCIYYNVYRGSKDKLLSKKYI